MAITYQMPPDTSEDEKIVGGILDKSQLGWVVLGGGVGAFFTIPLFQYLSLASILFFVPPFGVGVYFALKKVEGMTLFKYLIYKHKFKKKTKGYVNYKTRK